MFTEIPFPDFDPVLLDVGFFQVRWYGMAYLGGVVLGWLYLLRLNAEKYWPEGAPLSREDVEDLMVWSIVGIVIGGRLGYVFFYQPSVYMNDPMEILAIWHGGMSFHGGLLGVCTAVIGFAHFRERPIWSIADVFGCTAPIGLLLGRIANFVNGELYGRVTGTDQGMIFPYATPVGVPRHPSQLYEAALEGLLLFIVLRILFVRTDLRHKPGTLGGIFFIGYGASRFIIEYFREPDSFLGLLWMNFSMGQILSLPMILFGLFLIFRAQRTA